MKENSARSEMASEKMLWWPTINYGQVSFFSLFWPFWLVWVRKWRYKLSILFKWYRSAVCSNRILKYLWKSPGLEICHSRLLWGLFSWWEPSILFKILRKMLGKQISSFDSSWILKKCAKNYVPFDRKWPPFHVVMGRLLFFLIFFILLFFW